MTKSYNSVSNRNSEPEGEIQFISTQDLKKDIIKNTSKILEES